MKASSLFSYRYGRVLGIPLPGRSVYTVASDPGTRMSTLQRLSVTSTGGVKRLVSDNLAKRYDPAFDPSALADFDRNVVRDSFSATTCRPALLRFAMLRGFFAPDAYDELHLRNALSVPDLFKLSNSLHPGVLERVVCNQDAPLELLKFFVINRAELATLAYDKLSSRGGLDPRTLRVLSRSDNLWVLERIVAHKDTEPDVKADIRQRMKEHSF